MFGLKRLSEAYRLTKLYSDGKEYKLIGYLVPGKVNLLFHGFCEEVSSSTDDVHDAH